jgi:hypothetical protein
VTADEIEAAQLYASMRTDELLELQAAFKADLAAARRPETIAFAKGRLALIAVELDVRETE